MKLGGIPNVFPRSRMPAAGPTRFSPRPGLALGTGQIMTLVGNHAVAHAVRQAMIAAGGGFTGAYPITPATEILHLIRYWEANGRMPSLGYNAPSEHDAMSACIGASFGGVRTFIATASVGFMHMMEMVEWAGQNRLPIVMALSNRANAPLNIWHEDVDRARARDFAVELVAENHQQAYDLALQAFRIAERAHWLTIVNQAGFFTSHSSAQVRVIPDDAATGFVGEFQPLLDPFKKSISKGGLTSPAAYPLQRAQNFAGWAAIPRTIQETHDEFGKISGRAPGAFFNTYHAEDAEYLFVNYGFLSGTLRTFIDIMRGQGIKVGLISGTMYRPFPGRELVNAIYQQMPQVKVVGVFDGTLDPVDGPIYTDLSAALNRFGREYFPQLPPKMFDFRFGGGQNPYFSVLNGALYRMIEEANRPENRAVERPIQQLDRNGEGPAVELDLTDVEGLPPSVTDAVILEFLGRGGLGAVSAAANLVEIVNGGDRFAQGIPQFGSEKTGSPTFGTAVISKEPITSYSHEGKRQAVIAFRPDLVEARHINRIKDGGVLLVNTSLSPAEIRRQHQVPDSVRVFTIDATALSLKALGKDFPNNVLLAVLAHLYPELISLEQLRARITEDLRGKENKIIQGNLRLIEEAVSSLQGENLA